MCWKVALMQHPMYLIIKEDSLCAERTPPWGEPTIERYINRVGGNLAALRRYPQLRVGYEWSGLELELLAQEGPAVLAEMCTLAQEGRVAFYNGTYAQPHLHTLSSEANYRQFEYGMKVYRDLCGQAVLTYAHQESSVHDQVPQLLRAFGIEFATLPSFYCTLAWLDEGELAIRGGSDLHFVHGHEFVCWHGLDGSEINLYLNQGRGSTRPKDWWALHGTVDQLHAPPITIEAPDMLALDEAWLAEREQADFVLLDQALPERLAQCPPQARARLYANWSYIEGIRAEELSRSNWRAEAAALQAEALNALAFALLKRPADPSESVWKPILASQHHDVYCFSAPELRQKAIHWLQQATRDATHLAAAAARALVAEIDTGGRSGRPLVVFSTVPQAQHTVVVADVPVDRPQVVGPRGESVPAEDTPLGGGSTRVRFIAPAEGLGYATYWLRGGQDASQENDLGGPFTFENEFYRATVVPDGTFSSLALKPSGAELLDACRGRGNQIAGTDSAGLSLPNGPSKGEVWQPPKRGPELLWQATGAARVRRSPLGACVTAIGRLGAQVAAELAVRFYDELARIDLTWAFTFDGPTSIGTFYDDETKLRVQWPLAFAGDIHHDIAFGVIRARDGRPLLPASWIDICDGQKGLAYFHQGTPKHWVKDRTLVNLFAWGEDTCAIGSRVRASLWPKSFDQRLRGSHVIRCAVYAHTGDWRAADVIGAARSFGREPVVCLADAREGRLPASSRVLSFADPKVTVTVVKVEGSQVLCRLYAGAGEPASAAAEAQGLRTVELRSLARERIGGLDPFQIAELILEPEA